MLLLKNSSPRYAAPIQIWSTGVLAGLAGGVVEIAWIAIYQNLSGGKAASVARGVTETLFPKLVTSVAAIPLGIFIHMGLAVLLGVAIAVLVRSALPRSAPAALEPLAVVGLLIFVWAMNFLVVLPAINPAFVALVPYSASLTSKVLFGAAAALVMKLLNGPSRSSS